jgi:hypothetical protein
MKRPLLEKADVHSCSTPANHPKAVLRRN